MSSDDLLVAVERLFTLLHEWGLDIPSTGTN
jgi:hypothetical protein